jgi:hypothetical protein
MLEGRRDRPVCARCGETIGGPGKPDGEAVIVQAVRWSEAKQALVCHSDRSEGVHMGLHCGAGGFQDNLQQQNLYGPHVSPCPAKIYAVVYCSNCTLYVQRGLQPLDPALSQITLRAEDLPALRRLSAVVNRKAEALDLLQTAHLEAEWLDKGTEGERLLLTLYQGRGPGAVQQQVVTVDRAGCVVPLPTRPTGRPLGDSGRKETTVKTVEDIPVVEDHDNETDGS